MLPIYKEVIIRKPDLDTCLTGLIAGVHSSASIKVVQHEASSEKLADSKMLCIECGGSGLPHLGNFDHHVPEKYFPPACWQALSFFNYPDYELHRLVEYVCAVDEAMPLARSIEFPSLSAVFSGMLLCEPDRLKAFLAGMELLRLVLRSGMDPFAAMPNIKEWNRYIQAKIINREKCDQDFSNVMFMNSKNGLSICYQKSEGFGGSYRLYMLGCHVAILHNPAFGTPPVNKYTISGNGVMVSGLLPVLNELDKGWGGRSTIIGSPFEGSTLEPEKIIEIVRSSEDLK